MLELIFVGFWLVLTLQEPHGSRMALDCKRVVGRSRQAWDCKGEVVGRDRREGRCRWGRVLVRGRKVLEGGGRQALGRYRKVWVQSKKVLERNTLVLVEHRQILVLHMRALQVLVLHMRVLQVLALRMMALHFC